MDKRDRTFDSTDGRIERAKDSALGPHDSHPSHFDEAGEAIGGIGGVIAGAAVGSGAGPLGTLIGGLAGALGGWWSGRAVSEAATSLTYTDDAFYRAHFESSPNTLADRRYEDVRPAYQLGHIAAHNPDYANRNWSDVQSDLQRGWTAEHAKEYGDWSTMSNYASEGFNHGRSTLGTMANRSANATERIANKAANAVDDMKDRVDGNPASRPGPDATDSPRRLDTR
jgi:hypothetical protein